MAHRHKAQKGDGGPKNGPSKGPVTGGAGKTGLHGLSSEYNGKRAGADKAELDMGNSDVVREARNHKDQGTDRKGPLEAKRGGKIKKEHHEHHEHHEHKVEGHKSHHRLDKRARGGGVGSDKSPFSSAYHSHKKGG